MNINDAFTNVYTVFALVAVAVAILILAETIKRRDMRKKSR